MLLVFSMPRMPPLLNPFSGEYEHDRACQGDAGVYHPQSARIVGTICGDEFIQHSARIEAGGEFRHEPGYPRQSHICADPPGRSERGYIFQEAGGPDRFTQGIDNHIGQKRPQPWSRG